MYVTLILPPVILSLGAFFILKLRGFFFLHPIKSAKEALRGEGIRESVSSFILALSGTLGVGNIVGVTLAISAGGAGSVFWMIVSSLFAAVIKYAEVRLSFDSGKGEAGILGAVEKYFSRGAAMLYAALALVLSLTMGTALQSEAIKSSYESISESGMGIAAIPISLVLIFICLFGKKGVKRAVAIIIPIASITYILLTMLVIIPNLNKLPATVALILESAFTPRAGIGGIGGAIVSVGMRDGFSRGLLSNEAGAGTSSFSHTSSPSQSAYRAAFFGMLEVVFDTVILCSATAFAILLGSPEGCYPSGTAELSELFSRYAPLFGKEALFFSVLAFALSTSLCWYYYGTLCFAYLFGKRKRALFAPFFFISFILGLVFTGPLTVPLTDTALTLMTLITAVTLLRGSERIKELSLDFKKTESR